jgi:hypothetical protein
MIDVENAKNFFALIGIFTFSILVVLFFMCMHYHVSLWGVRKGMKKWFEKGMFKI